MHKQKVLLLQSGGIDSAMAAAKLLEQNYEVAAITLVKNTATDVLFPMQRADDLINKYDDYAWAMFDITEWDKALANHMENKFSEIIPPSCLICILAKITAMVTYCLELKISALALGYTGYQGSWAEQTAPAIEAQRTELARYGLDLLLPSISYDAKGVVTEQLLRRDLVPHSLEHPCCIADIGTQHTSPELAKRVISEAFVYLDSNAPTYTIIKTLGKFS